MNPTWPGSAASTTAARQRPLHQTPKKLDCTYESICETCSFFQTSIQFRPTLQAQHDDAAAKANTTEQTSSTND